MIEIIGKHNTAYVYLDEIDSETHGQLLNLCNQPQFEGNMIKIMPDCHVGSGCTIGTTMTFKDKVVPNLVGVDIGCGVLFAKIKGKIDLDLLDKTIREKIPSGFSIRNEPHYLAHTIDFSKLKIKEYDVKTPFQIKDIDRAMLSIGTLGGGNHFWEVSVDSCGNQYFLIHSGSRNFGKRIADIYQDVAIMGCKEKGIQKDLSYLSAQSMQDYINDQLIAREFAYKNRKAMLIIVTAAMNLEIESYNTTEHNYIERIKYDEYLLRKGAVKAEGEMVIPLNMRDGTILAKGKMNPNWNWSAPHGAGRILSRRQAKDSVSMEEFQESMSGIYTTSVSINTIDESPMAYKPAQMIIDSIGDSVEMIDILKPIYNFKASN